MTNYTLIENIIRSRSDVDDNEIYPGNIVWVNLDLVTARDYAGPQVVDLFESNYPCSDTFDNNKIIFTPDCYPYGNDPKHAIDQEKLRVFSKKHGIKLTDLGSGIGSHLMFKTGLAKPGDLVIGADSHYNLLGALGILGQGAGDMARRPRSHDRGGGVHPGAQPHGRHRQGRAVRTPGRRKRWSPRGHPRRRSGSDRAARRARGHARRRRPLGAPGADRRPHPAARRHGSRRLADLVAFPFVVLVDQEYYYM